MSTRFFACAAFGALVFAFHSAGCGSDDSSTPSGTGADAGADTGDNNFNMSDAQASTLDIEPHDPIVNFPATMSQPFQAFLSGSKTPVSGASWSVDSPLLGTIDQNGVFTPSGLIGGVTNVNATFTKLTATTSVTVNLSLTENPGNLSGAIQAALQAGGTADSAFRWLYPYDQTIFPRGIDAPVLQFDGTPVDGTYVHITTKYLDYKGFYGAANPARLTFTAAAWKAVALSAQASDPVSVEVTKISGTAVTGPIKETWAIAQGSLKGTVYYNTYSSPQAAGTGAIMRIKPGQAADVMAGGCTVCHSVSANGSVLTSGVDWGNGNPKNSGTFTLGPNPPPTSMYSEALGRYAFGALTPDGTKEMTNGISPTYTIRGLSGNVPSQLRDTKTGAQISAPGWDGAINYALMPSFSPDGKKLVFNRFDETPGHTLSVMDFADSTNTFSGLVDVAQDNGSILGWPYFTPDTKSVLFQAGTGWGTETGGPNGPTADLKAVDVASKTVTSLDTLNGYTGATPYLPYGASEAHMNYEPTVLPVAVGGYYWVVFTSRRVYGNTVGPGVDAYWPNNGPNSPRKKLWVAAIDINPMPGKDPSHPAFYLPGQEVTAGNMRGFWALDPCKQNGNGCETGDECCQGFCRSQTDPDGAVELVCVAPPSGCAHEYEKCTTASDCCDMNALCLNGHCAQPPPN